MKYVLLGVAVLLLVLFAYWGVRFFHLLNVSKGLIRSAIPYELPSSDPSTSVLVLGDSTAASVGAGTPYKSVPGQVSSFLHATYVENHAVSGAKVQDLPQQIAEAKRKDYSLILVQIGGNDIVRFHSASSTANELAKTLSTLPTSQKTIVISAGDVGSSPLFPLPLRLFYTHLTRSYHAAFASALSPLGITYVNLEQAPGNELFTTDPNTYFAADKFHPSAAGYGIWFEAVKPELGGLNHG